MENHRGDFAANRRVLTISMIAAGVGAACAFVAYLLLRLIALFTNLFFFQRLSFAPASPADAHLGWLIVVVPVIGGLIVGFIARFGSDKIRGHGIPEALEAILFGKSRMGLKVAILKPLSSGIVIGSGGPFGAEGPIIMTGGALGSLIAQNFRLTASERKTLLVAGAAAGMAAVFNTPVAAVLIAVELLLFEWRPRSLIPVALAVAIATTIRPLFLGSGPLFPMPAHGDMSALGFVSCIVAGLLCGGLGALLTMAVYVCEDAFHRLPLHWMWWPAIGGLVVGIGGYFQPRALGVGYDVIGDLLAGHLLLATALGLVIVKCIIWSIALGSGTSGGVLAPLLIVGAGLGTVLAGVLPGASPVLWPLVCMAGVLAGVMRSPLTATVFAFELSRDPAALLPLMLTSIVAYAFTVLVMRRSILTEKVARRGYHVYREYSVDPLERVHVEEVMTRNVTTIPGSMPAAEALDVYFGSRQKFRGYPIVDGEGALLGMIDRDELLAGIEDDPRPSRTLADLVAQPPIVAHPHEACRAIATRMAVHGVERLPVVADDHPPQLLGIISRSDLVNPSARLFEDEVKRERLNPIASADEA
jgi:H+/Cl- antiporter ClcA